jgi:hypothetical protein
MHPRARLRSKAHAIADGTPVAEWKPLKGRDNHRTNATSDVASAALPGGSCLFFGQCGPERQPWVQAPSAPPSTAKVAEQNTIDRQWRHQIALPASLCSSHSYVTIRLARSNQSAARTFPLGGSCGMSTRTPETWLERSPRLRPSSNPAVTASASRCCLPTLSASSDSAGSPARAPRRTGRVHARRDRAEPAAPRQAGGSGAPTPVARVA